MVDDNIQATPFLKDGKLSQLLDSSICGDDKHWLIERMVLAATLCIRRAPKFRPQISIVSPPVQIYPIIIILPFIKIKKFGDVSLL